MFVLIFTLLYYFLLRLMYFLFNILQMKIGDEIRRVGRKCERSLFIFEDVQKMPTGVLDAVRPFIDYHSDVDGVDFR